MKAKKILGVCAAACVLAMCVGFQDSGLGTHHYTAKSWLQIASREPSVRVQAAQQYSDKEFQDYKKTQRLLVKSRLVFLAALRKPEVFKLAGVQTQMKTSDPVAWLGGIVKVEFPDDADLMTVSCTRYDRHEAAILTNAVVEAYLAEIVNAERETRRNRLGELENIVAEKKTQLRKTLTELKQLLGNDAKSAEAKPPTVDVEMLQLNVKALEQLLIELRLEFERARVEMFAIPRVTLIESAEDPMSADQ